MGKNDYLEIFYELNSLIVLDHDLRQPKGVVRKPQVVTSEEEAINELPSEYLENAIDDGANPDTDKVKADVCIPFVVKLNRGSQNIYVRCLSGYRLRVVNVQFVDEEKQDTSGTLYKGPEFKLLRKKLQRELLKYLHTKDISTQLGYLIFLHCDRKDEREKLLWYEKMIKFTSSEHTKHEK